MKKPQRNLFASVFEAMRGLAHAFETERNFRIEAIAGLGVIIVALVAPLTWGERGGVLLFTILVLFAELVNTSLERIVDIVSPQYHRTAGAAKDVAAAAVLLIGIGAIIYAIAMIYCIMERVL